MATTTSDTNSVTCCSYLILPHNYNEVRLGMVRKNEGEQAVGATVERDIEARLLQQFRMMMDCFFNTGADFELISNGEFARDDMTKIPARICNQYGIRLNVASVNYAGHFEIDGECIGTLGEVFTKRSVSTRFGIGVDSADAEYSICINDSVAFNSISLHIPPHVANVEMTALRDELRDIVLMQQLKQPYYGKY